MIKNFLLVCASVGALLGQGTALAQNTKSDYLAIVGNSGATTGFQSTKIPSTLKSVNFGTPYAVKMIEYEAVDSSPGKMKFFLPPGTVAFDANLYFFLAYQEGKGVLRLNQPPETSFTNISPANVFTTENLGGSTGRAYDETVLNNLIAGKEVRYFSEGGSANFMVLSSPQNLVQPMSTGGYVYGNFQYPGGRLQRSLWKIYVKADCYDQWFNSTSTQWNTFGNPDENATHTCAGSSGGTPTPPELTGITLSRAVWNAATDANNTTITVKPQPAGAVLPACTASPSNLLTAGPASPTEALFNIIPSAVTAATPAVTLTCGSQSQTLDLQPVGTVATLQNTVVPTEVDGKAELQVILKHTDAELEANTDVTYWVAASVPQQFPFFNQNEVFLLASLSEGGFAWKVFEKSFDVNTVIFDKKTSPYNAVVTKQQKIKIPLQFSINQFKQLGIKIHLFYSQNGVNIHQVGSTIWDASAAN